MGGPELGLWCSSISDKFTLKEAETGGSIAGSQLCICTSKFGTIELAASTDLLFLFLMGNDETNLTLQA